MATRKSPSVKKPDVAGTQAKITIKKKKAASKKDAPLITPEERWHMISVAAYYMAEERGFVGGDPARDWLVAESQVDSLLEKRSTAV